MLKQYLVTGRDDNGDDLSLIVTADDPEQALWLWAEYFMDAGWGSWLLDHVDEAGDERVRVFQVPAVADRPHAHPWHGEVVERGSDLPLDVRRKLVARGTWEGWSTELWDVTDVGGWETFAGAGAGDFTFRFSAEMDVGPDDEEQMEKGSGCFTVSFPEGSAKPSNVSCNINGEPVGYAHT